MISPPVEIGLFAKPPSPGKVKTRLIPDIGALKATRVYEYCLQHTLSICQESSLEFQLFLTETSEDPMFLGLNTELQQGNDLGSRMQTAIEKLLEHNQAAIIIGSDCIDLSPRHLLLAAKTLEHHDLVLQPAEDGGYSLIGCRFFVPGLFENVRWSTDQVLQQTIANAESLGYRISLLETVRDIDTLHDLKHYPELVALIA